MGSHSAKSRQESGGAWTVICPGNQHFANLLDSSRPARGLLHTEEVTGSIPVSPTMTDLLEPLPPNIRQDQGPADLAARHPVRGR